MSKGKTMPLGFEKMNNIQVYGDGDGNIIIEEWSSDTFADGDLIGKVKISVDRFQMIVNNVSSLVLEAWDGVKE
jgi:hypothetical protein